MDQRYRRAAIERAQAEYGSNYERLRFVSENEAKVAEEKRKGIIERLGNRVQQTAGGTKLYSGELSPGCKACVAGSWSCLFINGNCNAN